MRWENDDVTKHEAQSLFVICSLAECVCRRSSSSWTPQGVYLESNRDECTVSLVYAVHLEKQGSVSFTYQYPDNNIFFEFYVSQEQAACEVTAWLKSVIY